MDNKKILFLEDAINRDVLLFKAINKCEPLEPLLDHLSNKQEARYWDFLSRKMGLFIGNVPLSSHYEHQPFYLFERAVISHIQEWLSDEEFKAKLFNIKTT